MTGATDTARILDGRALAREVRERVRATAEARRADGAPVRLDAVIVEGDPASGIYARNQRRTCEEVGIEYRLHALPSHAGFEDIAGRILLLNADAKVRAIMLHLPLPDGLETERIQSLIAVEKDVEGVNPANIGNVVYGRRSLVPCTALAVMELIEAARVELRGAACAVVGASNIVGKPIAVLLMRADATVISMNRWTRDLPEFTRRADVIVAAAGVPGLITAGMVRPGAVVIDVGVNRVADPDGSERTVGDVDFDAVRRVAGAISPVPGGVGPMTVAMLLRNTVAAQA